MFFLANPAFQAVIMEEVMAVTVTVDQCTLHGIPVLEADHTTIPDEAAVLATVTTMGVVEVTRKSSKTVTTFVLLFL